MDDELGFSCYDTSDLFFNACNYGSRFLGCCSDGDHNKVCGEDCRDDKPFPAYFESRYFDNMTNVPSGQCDDGYEWYVCQSIIQLDDMGYSYFGCFSGDPCPDNSTALVGSSRTPKDLIDYSPYSLIEYPGSSPTSTSSGAAATSVAIPSVGPSPKIFITVSATSGLQTPSATHPLSSLATHLPSRSSTGAIVGGAIGGAAVAAIAIAIGFMAMYCRRRKGRQISKTASSEKSGDSTSPTPVPAYSATDPNRVAQQPTQTAMPFRDVSSAPSRPCSELSSLGPAISPVPGVPTGLMRTGLIPYSPNQAQVEGNNLTNSSGAFPHAAPDADYFGKAV